MVERAVGLIERHGEYISEVDVLLTHTQLPDWPVLGAGEWPGGWDCGPLCAGRTQRRLRGIYST